MTFFPALAIDAHRDFVSGFCSNPRRLFPAKRKSTCRKPRRTVLFTDNYAVRPRSTSHPPPLPGATHGSARLPATSSQISFLNFSQQRHCPQFFVHLPEACVVWQIAPHTRAGHKLSTADAGASERTVYGGGTNSCMEKSKSRGLVRCFSDPIVRRLPVNVMRSHQRVDRLFHQASGRLQHQIVPLAVYDPLSRFDLCLVHADRSTSVVIEYKLRAMRHHSVIVGHGVPQSLNIILYNRKSYFENTVRRTVAPLSRQLPTDLPKA